MTEAPTEEREIADYWKARAEAAEENLRLELVSREQVSAVLIARAEAAEAKWLAEHDRADALSFEADRWKERAEKEQAAGMAVATEAARWRNDAERLAARVRFHWARSGIVEDKDALAAHDALCEPAPPEA